MCYNDFRNAQQPEPIVSLKNLKIIGYRTITDISETQSTEKVQVLKAYNLQGQEIPVNTKGEVIILLYDNGVREKAYLAE